MLVKCNFSRGSVCKKAFEKQMENVSFFIVLCVVLGTSPGLHPGLRCRANNILGIIPVMILRVKNNAMTDPYCSGLF